MLFVIELRIFVSPL